MPLAAVKTTGNAGDVTAVNICFAFIHNALSMGDFMEQDIKVSNSCIRDMNLDVCMSNGAIKKYPLLSASKNVCLECTWSRRSHEELGSRVCINTIFCLHPVDPLVSSFAGE